MKTFKLGVWVRKIVGNSGLSQKDLSRVTGIHASSLSLNLAGKRRWNEDQVDAICRALQIPGDTIPEVDDGGLTWKKADWVELPGFVYRCFYDDVEVRCGDSSFSSTTFRKDGVIYEVIGPVFIRWGRT